jgi:hypothetical protein
LIEVLRPLPEATKFLSQRRNPTLAFAFPGRSSRASLTTS